MLDNHPDRDEMSERERPVRSSDDLGTASDREVPLAPAASTDVINRWLDGELPEPTGLRGDAARSVEFWRRMEEETDVRRRMATPTHLAAKIMASLPPVSSSEIEERWWRKDLRLTPTIALTVAAGLVMLGVIFGQVLAR